MLNKIMEAVENFSSLNGYGFKEEANELKIKSIIDTGKATDKWIILNPNIDLNSRLGRERLKPEDHTCSIDIFLTEKSNEGYINRDNANAFVELSALIVWFVNNEVKSQNIYHTRAIESYNLSTRSRFLDTGFAGAMLTLNLNFFDKDIPICHE